MSKLGREEESLLDTLLNEVIFDQVIDDRSVYATDTGPRKITLKATCIFFFTANKRNFYSYTLKKRL